MLYLMTSNDDRKTPASRCMWTLQTNHPATVHLNFRSEAHMRNGGSDVWLRRDGWQPNASLRSTVSSGIPNGPYSGPVYTKHFGAAGRIQLNGSNNWEGTYFVFFELHAPPTPGAPQTESAGR